MLKINKNKSILQHERDFTFYMCSHIYLQLLLLIISIAVPYKPTLRCVIYICMATQ